MNIIFDCDDVLRDFIPSVVKQYNKQYGEKNSIDDIIHFDINMCLPRIGDFKHYIWNHPKLLRNSPVLPNTKYVMSMLQKKGYTIGIATNQFPDLEEHTLHWLNENGIPYNFIFFGREKHLLKGDYFVDDKITNCVKFQESNPDAKVFLMNKPWNKEYECSGKIKRIYDIKDILQYIN